MQNLEVYSQPCFLAHLDEPAANVKHNQFIHDPHGTHPPTHLNVKKPTMPSWQRLIQTFLSRGRKRQGSLCPENNKNCAEHRGQKNTSKEVKNVWLGVILLNIAHGLPLTPELRLTAPTCICLPTNVSTNLIIPMDMESRGL